MLTVQTPKINGILVVNFGGNSVGSIKTLRGATIGSINNAALLVKLGYVKAPEKP